MIKEFEHIEFIEETHKYFDRGVEKPSVSSIISTFYEEFNEELILPKYSAKVGIDPNQIKNAWRTQNSKETNEGSRVHNFAELYATQKYIEKKKDSELVLAQSSQDLGVIKWWNDVGSKFKLLGLEQIVCTDKYCGTADILLGDKNNCLIADYKTNKDIHKRPFHTLKYPFNFLPDTPYNKYCIQFSLYQIALEDIGYNVTDRILIWLRKDEDGNLYQEFHTEDYTRILRKYLKIPKKTT